jgi:hypothetical protein
MMEALIDALAYLLLIGGALAVCIALAAGICRLAGKIRRIDRNGDWDDQRTRENRQYVRNRLGHV